MKKIGLTLMYISIVVGLIGCMISGSVRDETGKGIEGVSVYLISDKETRTDTTGPNGDFSFSSVPLGKIIVQPGEFGESDPEFYEIRKGPLDIKNIEFTLSKVIRIGLPYGTGGALSLLVGVDLAAKCRKAIQENNGVVVPFSPLDKKTLLNEKLETINGLILPGGVDIDPSFYGEVAHEMLEIVEKVLDQLEFDALEYAENHELPILGLCRGIQVINVFHGGTLYQDIPSQVQTTPVVIHRDKSEMCFHDMTLYPETWLAGILNQSSIIVNSRHHQAIKDLAPGFIISAISPDGLIEAIEKTGSPFVMGVQFHPEQLRETNPEFNRIFETFITEAKKVSRQAAAN